MFHSSNKKGISVIMSDVLILLLGFCMMLVIFRSHTSAVTSAQVVAAFVDDLCFYMPAKIAQKLQLALPLCIGVFV